MLLSPAGSEPIKGVNINSPASSLSAGILRPRLLPIMHGAVTGATLVRLTGMTGIADLSVHQNSITKDREITCPSKSSCGFFQTFYSDNSFCCCNNLNFLTVEQIKKILFTWNTCLHVYFM